MARAHQPISYIPLGAPFLATLVQGLVNRTAGYPEQLMQMQILLPTRRAVRVMRDLFLDATDGRPLLLPRLQAIADVDADELDILIAAATGNVPDIQSAISSTERLSILAEQIRKRDSAYDLARALDLSQLLAQLIDDVENEGLDLNRFERLVPDIYATHWQETLQFLDIVRIFWPQILVERGMMDPAQRRNRLLETLAQHWLTHPPAHPVLIAGVTGSLPAVAGLMDVVRGLPLGEIILPGFDPQFMALPGYLIDDVHPMRDLHHLLTKFDVMPDAVPVWAGTGKSVSPQPEWLSFWTEVMAPSALTSRWANLKQQSPDRLNKISGHITQALDVIELDTAAAEAMAVALAMRETLAVTDKTVAVVTPDRNLATQIMACCARLGVDVNDSAGTLLVKTGQAGFLLLILDIVMDQLHPVDVLALLRHHLWGGDRNGLDQLDATGLRGLRPPRDLAAFREEICHRLNDTAVPPCLDRLLQAFAPLWDDAETMLPLQTRLQQHVQIAESLAGHDAAGHSLLWQDEDGEALSRTLAQLLENSAQMPPLTLRDYADLLRHIWTAQTSNKIDTSHPRAVLLGTFEARLIGADHMILAGMNEGVWPPDPGFDPWLSRAMRSDFGLPALDTKVGRLAHDVLQFVAAPRVTLTRTRRQSGAVTIPSRWLQRMDTVLSAINRELPAVLRRPDIAVLVAALDRPDGPARPVARPAPSPPVSLRPITLSATRLETLMRDPYSIYAAKILRLSALDDFDEPVSPALLGQVMHAVLQEFNQGHADVLPSTTHSDLRTLLDDKLTAAIPDATVRAPLQPRLLLALHRYLEVERTWRDTGARPVLHETTWTVPVKTPQGDVTVTARVDRIDRCADGKIAVFDYKTTTALPSIKDVTLGLAPQLAIEALVVERGVCADHTLPRPEVGLMALWQVAPRESRLLIWGDEEKNKLRPVLDGTWDGLSRLLVTFANDATPYYSLPDIAARPRYSDFEHLARVKEWSVGGDGGDE